MLIRWLFDIDLMEVFYVFVIMVKVFFFGDNCFNYIVSNRVWCRFVISWFIGFFWMWYEFCFGLNLVLWIMFLYWKKVS